MGGYARPDLLRDGRRLVPIERPVCCRSGRSPDRRRDRERGARRSAHGGADPRDDRFGSQRRFPAVPHHSGFRHPDAGAADGDPRERRLRRRGLVDAVRRRRHNRIRADRTAGAAPAAHVPTAARRGGERDGPRHFGADRHRATGVAFSGRRGRHRNPPCPVEPRILWPPRRWTCSSPRSATG